MLGQVSPMAKGAVGGDLDNDREHWDALVVSASLSEVFLCHPDGMTDLVVNSAGITAVASMGACPCQAQRDYSGTHGHLEAT